MKKGFPVYIPEYKHYLLVVRGEEKVSATMVTVPVYSEESKFSLKPTGGWGSKSFGFELQNGALVKFNSSNDGKGAETLAGVGAIVSGAGAVASGAGAIKAAAAAAELEEAEEKLESASTKLEAAKVELGDAAKSLTVAGNSPSKSELVTQLKGEIQLHTELVKELSLDVDAARAAFQAALEACALCKSGGDGALVEVYELIDDGTGTRALRPVGESP